MRVVVRHSARGVYYAGYGRWVADPCEAIQFETVKRAEDLSRNESLDQVEVAVMFGDSSLDFVVPVKP